MDCLDRRHWLIHQKVRQSTEVCVFCTFVRTRGASTIRDPSRIASRAYSSTRANGASASAAVARQNDEDDDFPLLKRNASASPWSTSNSIKQRAPLPPTPTTTPRFSKVGGPNDRGNDSYSFRTRGDRREGRTNRLHLSDSSLSVEQDFRSQPRFNRPNHRRPNFREPDNELPDQPRDRADTEDRPLRIRKFTARGQSLEGPPHAKQSSVGDAETRSTFRRSFTDPYGRDNARSQEHKSSRSRGSRYNNFSPDPKLPPKPNAPDPSSITETTWETRSVDETSAFTPMGAAPRAASRSEKEDISARRFGGFAGPRSDDSFVQPDRDDRQNTKKPFRGSGRFELEGEEDASVDLPAEQKMSFPSRQRSARRGSAHFDFDMMEAEDALNGKKKRGKKARVAKAEVEDQKPTLVIPEFMTVQQLAQSMKIKVDDLVRRLEEEGFEGARHDHLLDAETSTMFADMYGFEPVAGSDGIQDLVARPPPEDVSALPHRPPIVTIMGHVDHGKTTILDWLRKSSVAAGEHGGITQHIGAFSVTMPGTERQITFLDTPGHEAFLDMRRRGANVTDIVVLVVAADDSVKPQTVEAIKHALEAQVQLIVAINKVDKHDADIEQVKQDLTRHDIVVEDYGGDYQAIPVSGKTGQGMEQLEEAIITLADVLDLRAEQDGPAEGQILESKVTNAGRVATVLVRRGVLRVGDFIVAGSTWGRVRTLRNDAGQLVQAAYPGDPVQVDGWRGSDPTAGLEVLQADNEQQAKEVVDLRLERAEIAQTSSSLATMNVARAQEAEARAKVLEWEAENKISYRTRSHAEGWIEGNAASGPKEVHFVIKADVAGSVEAIVAAVSGIGNHEVRANVVYSGTGPVTESDIRMLSATGETGYAISFNQPVDGAMHQLAQAAGLGIIDQNIIYKVTDVVKEKVEAALPPLVTQRVTGEAEVGKMFDITVKKEKIRIAGCKVTNGTISRSHQVRVLRNGETVYTGSLDSLKHIKKDVTEMRKGTECGLGFKDWDGAQEGDQVQCFEEKEEARKLY